MTWYGTDITNINPFTAVLTSYLVMHNLVAVCPSAEYTRHTAHSSNAATSSIVGTWHAIGYLWAIYVHWYNLPAMLLNTNWSLR